MLIKLPLPGIAGVALSMLTLPLQAAPAPSAMNLRATASEPSTLEQVHYYRRHYRYYRPYFYHRHRYWRHW